jgi:beta-N-acetylhexosaminidase
VRTGEISTARLDESVLKVLKLKASLGLPRARVVDVGRVASVVGRPENVALGQQVADEAVTLVRDDGHVIPLRRPGSAAAGERPAGRGLVAIVLSDDVRGRSGRVLEREIQVRVPDANVIFVDGRIADAVREDVLQAVSGAETVVVAAFVAPSPGQSAQGSGPGDPTGRLLQGVLDRAGDKTTVIAVGSPYVAQHFPRIRTYLCTLSSASVSERSAVKALFGEMALGGRLPVRIPGVAGLGEGITREASR